MGLNIGNILKGIAPFIASALPGPFGAVAKTVLGSVFGIDAEGKDADAKIEEAVKQATPEQIIELKKVEQEFQARMAQMGFTTITELEKLEKEDRASARNREVELAKAGVRDRTPMFLAFAAVAGFVAVLIFVLTADLDTWGQTKVGIVTGLLGTLTTIVVMIFGYYFGSSSGSSQKTAMMQKLTDKL